jgi:hypothetical protein
LAPEASGDGKAVKLDSNSSISEVKRIWDKKQPPTTASAAL